MGMEFYGNSYKGNDEPIFVGIPTFLKLPWIRSHEELKSVKPDVALLENLLTLEQLFVLEQDMVPEQSGRRLLFLLHHMSILT